MTFLAIMNWSGSNRVVKHSLPFATLVEAQAFAAKGGTLPGTNAGAFAVERPGGGSEDWLVDPVAKTISLSPVIIPKPTTISFFAFQERFTEAERVAILKWTDQIDPATNTLFRADWKEKFRRAEVRGDVDLAGPAASAFLDKLVADGVGGINAARKIVILTP